MPGPGDASRFPTKGRPKGATGKVSRAFKESVLRVYNKLGGDQAFVEWAQQQKNKALFYQICARLIPHEVTGPNGGPVQIKTIVHEHQP